jgi:hypothetical protein
VNVRVNAIVIGVIVVGMTMTGGIVIVIEIVVTGIVSSLTLN